MLIFTTLQLGMLSLEQLGGFQTCPKHFPVANLKDLIGTGISPQKRIVGKGIRRRAYFRPLIFWLVGGFIFFILFRGVKTTNQWLLTLEMFASRFQQVWFITHRNQLGWCVLHELQLHLTARWRMRLWLVDVGGIIRKFLFLIAEVHWHIYAYIHVKQKNKPSPNHHHK